MFKAGGQVLLLKVEYEKSFYGYLLKEFNRIKKNIPMHIDIFTRKGTVFVISLDDGLSAAFIYMAYCKAREKKLKVSLLYARYIEEDFFPSEIIKIGKKWLNKRVSKREIKLLEKYNITEHVFTRWCRW
jgi:hypothetical protein